LTTAARAATDWKSVGHFVRVSSSFRHLAASSGLPRAS
jgi:hypothetical protein